MPTKKPKTTKIPTSHRMSAKNVDTMPAQVTPTAAAIDEMTADPYHEAALAEADAKTAEQTQADFARLPQPNAIDPDLGAHLRPISTGDALVNVGAHAMSHARLPECHRPPAGVHEAIAAALPSLLGRR